MIDIQKITTDTQEAVKELIALSKVQQGQIIVLGCSSSEILGAKIGSASNLEVAQAVFNGLMPQIKSLGLFLAVQCCEHLNRALIVERTLLEKNSWQEVTVLPQPNAGGAMATIAYQNFSSAAVCSHIVADAGLDIGDTMIGMHLKHVCVPLRLKIKSIGQAHLTAAKSRPPLIGGNRACYP